MLTYALRRVLLLVPTYVGITAVTFAVVHLAPGEPTLLTDDAGMSQAMSEATFQRLEAHFGLDQPLHVQYGRWLWRSLTLDFGQSFSDSRPVLVKIGERLPWTLLLSVISLAGGLVISIAIGVRSAMRSGGRFDRVISTLLYALYSVPSYVAAMLLIVAVVVIPIPGIPVSGAYADDVASMSFGGKLVSIGQHLLLIAICFTYPSLAYQSRLVRGNMMEVLEQDYVRTARAKGLTESAVVWRHGFRNTFVPMITLLGLLLPTVVSGSVILEVMFQYPGVGRLFYEAVLQRDYPTVMALSSLTAMLVLLATLIADLAYAWADPRIRYDDARA